jgi:hypothetical protein
MNNKTALHTAARAYCQDRFREWMETYKDLQIKEKWQVENLFKPGWDYSAEAYRIFPRYRINAAIQIEVERLTPNSSSTFEELRCQLVRACDVAKARLDAELNNSNAREALGEEADDYRAYIQVLVEADLTDVLPLPFKRVITEEESKKLWKQLKAAWDIGGGPWFPLKEGQVPPHLITFHCDYFGAMSGAQLLRKTLETRGITRIFQLQEFCPPEPEYEVELSNLEPAYGSGGEQYSTSDPTDWVVYASHESSITVCGEWLTTVFKEEWPEWSKRVYGGPYSTEDLRGTWETK